MKGILFNAKDSLNALSPLWTVSDRMSFLFVVFLFYVMDYLKQCVLCVYFSKMKEDGSMTNSVDWCKNMSI